MNDNDVEPASFSVDANEWTSDKASVTWDIGVKVLKGIDPECSAEIVRRISFSTSFSEPTIQADLGNARSKIAISVRNSGSGSYPETTQTSAGLRAKLAWKSSASKTLEVMSTVLDGRRMRVPAL